MTSFTEMIEELRPHHNELCLLYDTDIVRLIGVGEDDMDFYYIVQNMNHRSVSKDGTTVVWCSAVGHIRPLRDILPSDSYERADNVHAPNGCQPTDEFLVEDKSIWDKGSNLQRRTSCCGRFALTFDEANPGDRFSLWRCYPDEEKEDALILKGEMAPLEAIVQAVIREMAEYDRFAQAADEVINEAENLIQKDKP